jgi:hypothetical protein
MPAMTLRERLVWALFKATFHPDEDEAVMRQKWLDWHDEQRQHYRRADAVLAEIAAAGMVLVPRQPAEAMDKAYYEAHARAANVFASASEAYRAMLSAAPSVGE